MCLSGDRWTISHTHMSKKSACLIYRNCCKRLNHRVCVTLWKKADFELYMIDLTTIEKRNKKENRKFNILFFDFFNILMLSIISPCLVKKPNVEYVFSIIHNTYIHLESQFSDFFSISCNKTRVERNRKEKEKECCMYVCVHFCWDVVTDAQLECS